MNEPWNITLFGGLHARRGEQVVTRFKTQKAASLFAYLAFHARQAHSREILVELLWPESDAATLRNSLSVALSSLRNQFEPPGVPQGAVLRADRFSVGLNPATVTTDVARFEQALRAAAQAASGTEREQHLARAVGLYAGPLLPGFYEPWIPAEQERLAGLFFDAVDTLVGHHEAAGDTRAALAHARHAVAADPRREEGQAHLIRLLASGGQPGAALRQYKEYETLLEADAGDEPSAALRALFRRVEKESGFAAPPAAPAAAPVAPPKPAPAPAAFARGDGPATTTFLLTDRTGDPHPERRAADAVLRREFARHGGREVRATGDGFVVAFAGAGRALACAVAAQKALAAEVSPGGGGGVGALGVRMALHTGDVLLPDAAGGGGDGGGVGGGGPVLHYASRMLTAAHGGQVLVSEATAGLLPADLRTESAAAEEGVHLSDLGVYRLRDVPGGAGRLFQARWPGMARADFGPLDAEAGHPSNLPLRFTRFFGRGAEIERLRETLLSWEVRLVTVTGPGGTGKTRLAVEVAERLADAFAGAAYFVPLADVGDPALIPGAVLDALRLPRSGHREPLARAVEALARRPTLLVLDNFEQLSGGGHDGVGGGGAEVVRALLAGAPSLKVLVTSRQPVGLSGEREFALSPLPVPGGRETPEQLSLFESVQLFIDRAQQVRPDFQVGNGNAAAVEALAVGLEGIPLAIELAAARAQVFTPAQMLAQLSHRFDFLTSRRRDVGERQRTLRGAIDWSYRLLSPELRRFFGRLSVFRGGWTADAAEAVCEEPLALDYLEQLREASLVVSDDAGSGDAGSGAAGPGMRFRMLETLREFAGEPLSPEERTLLRRGHLRHFRDAAEAAETFLTGPEQGAWLERLDAEHENLRAALRWSLGEGDAPEDGLRVAAALPKFWESRGFLREGGDWLERGLAAGGVPDDLRAKGLNGLGTLAAGRGDYAAARDAFEHALRIGRERGDRRAVAAALGGLGRVANDLADYARARTLAEESLALFREVGDRERTAGALYTLAHTAESRGEYDAARAMAEESLALRREIGHQVGIAYSLCGLGSLSMHQGDFAGAQRRYEEGLALQRAVGDRRGAAYTLMNLGVLASYRDDLAASRAWFEQSLPLFEEIGDRDGVANTLNNLGELARMEGDFAAAAVWMEKALTLYRDLGDRESIAVALDASAFLESQRGRPERAARLFGAATALREEIGVPLRPVEAEERQAGVDAVRAALGEAAFADAFAQGRALPWEAAVAFALEK